MKENGFTQKEASTGYPSETITDANYTDGLVLLENKSVYAESSLYNLEQAARSIDLYVNLDKIEFMCFNKIVLSH